MSATEGERTGEAPSLEAEIERLARVPVLLVACDYDGTIAPITDDPMAAVPSRDTVVALRALAELPQTHVAVISGRALRDLAALSRLPAEIRLVGSHGSEFDIGFGRDLDPERRRLRDLLQQRVEEVAAAFEGSYVEPKPTAVAFHHRRLSPEAAERALAMLRPLTEMPGVFTRRARDVLELGVERTDKGQALEKVRAATGATAVLYLGDDVSDEDAFAVLRGPDVGVKVGDGPTIAPHRVADSTAVARLLSRLVAVRAEWLAGESVVPIERHSLLSDQRTMALVTPDARISWLCLPRVDSSAVFAELVGGPTAGYFAVRPLERANPLGQRYVGDTMVVETDFGAMRVTDYLDCSGGRPDRLAGRSDLVRVLEGRGRAVIEFAPRLDFGRLPTRLAVREGGVEVIDSHDLLVLRAPGVSWSLRSEGDHQTAIGEADLDAGPVVLELRCGTASLRPEAVTEIQRRDATAGFWSRWASRLRLPPVRPDLVRRSALVLRALCYGPTGAVCAAATTSLPEHLGGIRNWDYRYCWLRDAAWSVAALARLGSVEEAMAYLDWVLRILELRDDPERLAPVYLVTGHHLPPEAEIAELAGYAGSRPVRVGNAAEHQVQLDVFGPIVDLVWILARHGAPLSARHYRLVEAMVGAVARRWREPDHGIWEIRRPPRHHTYSRTMCWLTADAGARVAAEFFGRDRPDWQELAETIRADVLEHGWSERAGAFTAAYGSDDLDASVLATGLWGLVDPDDERFRRTVEAVEGALRRGPTVYRYRYDDGLPGTEGGFHLMTSWLIDAYHVVGRTAEAAELFDDLCGLVGPTGLLSEEWDPASGRALGNHPQAYSHLGLIGNAIRLSGAWD